MKTILVPTDFSSNAEKALKYAIRLANLFSAEIILMHSLELNQTQTPLINTMKEVLAEKAENDIRELKQKIIKKHPGLNIKSATMSGEPAEAIKTTAKKLGADIIVMGTKGASGLKKLLLGSITADVIINAPCPVFTIPEKNGYRKIKKICFATDFNENDIDAIDALIVIANGFNAELIITHISGSAEEEKEAFDKFVQTAKTYSYYYRTETKFIESEDVIAGLNNFIEDNDIDILALSRRKRDFLENFFHRSITKEIAYSATIPVFIFQS
jgi:nucleotide-binding universal stress UspA family protein